MLAKELYGRFQLVVTNVQVKYLRVSQEKVVEGVSPPLSSGMLLIGTTV